MNPHQLAKEECANYDGGGCRNIIILDDLTNHVGPRLERCLLLDGQKCHYFEECILPMKDFTKDARKEKMMKDAAAAYKMSSTANFDHYNASNSRLNGPCAMTGQVVRVPALPERRISKNTSKTGYLKNDPA